MNKHKKDFKHFYTELTFFVQNHRTFCTKKTFFVQTKQQQNVTEGY